MEPRDEVLYQRIRQGDLTAFEVLYERHRRGLFRFIHGYLKNHEEAEEVFHEAFMQVLKADSLQFEQGSFQGWVYLVSRNLCLNRIRSRQRSDKATALEIEEPSPNAEALLADRDLSAQIHAATTKLPDNLSQVLKLRLSEPNFSPAAWWTTWERSSSARKLMASGTRRSSRTCPITSR